MITARLPSRGSDAWGCGDFGASRGSRTHKGIDYACAPGTIIMAPYNGRVTKIGYPYSDDLSYRYVEVTDTGGRKHRVFYVNPLVTIGSDVVAGRSVIGEAQDICARYPDKGNGPMTNHVHYEVKVGQREYIDPDTV